MRFDTDDVRNILLVVLILVVGVGFAATMGQALPEQQAFGVRAVAPYQGNAADGVTTSVNSALVGGKTITGGAQSFLTDTDGRAIVQAYGATTTTLDGEEIVLGTGDNYIGRVNITESVTIVVTDSDGNLNVRQASRGALVADVTMQIADTDVGSANPVPVTDTAGSLTTDIDPRHLDAIDTNRLVTIDHEHAEVHSGAMHHASHTADMADDTGRYIWFTTGASTAHFAMAVAGGGELSVSMWETPTLTGGTLITPVNMRRNVAMSASSVISHTPTVTSTGTVTLFLDLLIPGGSGPGNSTTGGDARQEIEWLLAANRSHLIQIWNTAGSTISTTWQAEWYEE